MRQANWDRVKQIFQEALEKSGPDRDRLVAVRCGDDVELRSQVEALLAAHREAGAFLDSKTVEGAGDAAAAAARLAGQDRPDGPGARIGPYKLLQQTASTPTGDRSDSTAAADRRSLPDGNSC